MNIAEIETELEELTERTFDPATFVFRLLEIYHAPKATLTKLAQGSSNHGIAANDLLWKNKIYFRFALRGFCASEIDVMLQDPLTKKHKPRFLFVTDGVEFYCRDTRTEQSVYEPLERLRESFLFLLPLANIERYEAPDENPADIKATTRVAKLYDAVLEANADWIERDYTHDLNQFMARLLFCFFAEDTGIFEKDVFTSTVMNLSNEDGSDVAEVIERIFAALANPSSRREGLPDYTRKFPYVNGGLFEEQTKVPKFSRRSRRFLKECGELYWKDINPDIFGSMIQAVAQPGLREDMGMHYTSMPNILRVLKPLFLDSLEEEFAAAYDNESKLRRLLQRIYLIRVLDPACGSGNFLIIAYKELRTLEMRIFERQKEIGTQWMLPMTEVKLTQFYGIELTDFAAETAKLSLWIAEYQMNEAFKAMFGRSPPNLPLQGGGNIVHGNANLIAWQQVCPHSDEHETYIVGNPPYLGRANQTPEQKEDMRAIFEPLAKSYKNLDYVACWYAKAAQYCSRSKASAALVTTNSVCQGEQVGILWPIVLGLGVEIGFAYQPFKWRNSAANNAAVTCVIVGIRRASKQPKLLFSEALAKRVANISPYLLEGDNLIVLKRSKPLSLERKMSFGSMANDGGHLILAPEDRAEILAAEPGADRFLRRLYGSQEFTKGIERWCIWIDDADVEEAMEFASIRTRVEATKASREKSDRATTKELASVPYRFAEVRHRNSDAIIVPKNTSERRRYITAGYIDSGSVISDLAFAVYDAEPYLFSIVSSRLHYIWGSAVGGRFKMDPRYSSTLVFNTFPLPKLSAEQKQMLEDLAFEILEARESNPGRTISWMYDPKTMPDQLRAAHENLDEALEKIYVGRRFESDVDRLEHLFKLYGTLTSKSAHKLGK